MKQYFRDHYWLSNENYKIGLLHGLPLPNVKRTPVNLCRCDAFPWVHGHQVSTRCCEGGREPRRVKAVLYAPEMEPDRSYPDGEWCADCGPHDGVA